MLRSRVPRIAAPARSTASSKIISALVALADLVSSAAGRVDRLKADECSSSVVSIARRPRSRSHNGISRETSSPLS